MALDIWGRVVADDSDYDIAEAKRAAQVRSAVAAHMAQHPAARAEPVVPREADPLSTPDPMPASQAVRAPSQRSDGRPRPTDPVGVLAAALDHAHDDAECERLLAAAPKDVREQWAAGQHYERFMRLTAQPDEYDLFEHALGAAASDADRATLIAGRTPAFLVEWAWRQRAGGEGWRRRYLDMVTGNET